VSPPWASRWAGRVLDVDGIVALQLGLASFVGVSGPAGRPGRDVGRSVSAKEVYHIQDLANHHGGVVRVGDYLYGTNNTSLLCLDFKTGETKWDNRSVGKGSIMAADGPLYVRSEKGAIALVEATPDGYKELSRFEQPDRSKKNAWPHPVVAGAACTCTIRTSCSASTSRINKRHRECCSFVRESIRKQVAGTEEGSGTRSGNSGDFSAVITAG